MPDHPSLIRRAIRAILRTGLTLGVIGLAALAVLAGQTVLSTHLSADNGPDPAPPAEVAVAIVALQPTYATERRFAGQFEPRQEIALGFEDAGTIAAILVTEGDNVEAGAVIARTDTRLLDAERARLKASRTALDAQVELAERTNTRQAALRTRGFATDQTVDDTSLSLARLQAQVAEIDAGLVALDVRLDKAVLQAPFAGLVGERLLDEGTVTGPGAPVVTLLQDGPILFRAGLDPALAADMAIGTTIAVSVGDQTVDAQLDRLAPELETQTRARIAFFAVDGLAPPSRTAGEVLLTRTVTAPQPGAWLPLAALRQGPRGTWQVVTVEDGPDGPVAAVEAVEIVEAEGGRAFVTGTIRDGMRYVPEGAHRIVPGQRLRILDGTEATAWAR